MQGSPCAFHHVNDVSVYRIAENFRKYDFRGENFRGLLTFAAPKDATPQIAQRKLLHIATKL